ncbi:MAG: hypothetical protein PHS93_08405 [Candidatus Omnitrophica bacterium]|nr:hypothetical protein [Candidatus Omnitrophota bacterium]MDD5353164.1 hypothetical protein [Candidatus Omnitrophota bacterium]MDD5551123.1 hypothetical protein [Candidatus Omnitrophota bacterium]
MEVLSLILAGTAGALTKDIFKDNKLILPCVKDGAIVLGFLGGAIIGGAVGFLVDHSPLVAFLSGFTGYQILANLIPKEGKK